MSLFCFLLRKGEIEIETILAVVILVVDVFAVLLGDVHAEHVLVNVLIALCLIDELWVISLAEILDDDGQTFRQVLNTYVEGTLSFCCLTHVQLMTDLFFYTLLYAGKYRPVDILADDIVLEQ